MLLKGGLFFLLKLDGIANGKHIDLANDTGLPPGTPVSVEIVERPRLSVEEKRALAHRLCGVWKDDKEIQAIFKEILKQRRASRPREISLDLPS